MLCFLILCVTFHCRTFSTCNDYHASSALLHLEGHCSQETKEHGLHRVNRHTRHHITSHNIQNSQFHTACLPPVRHSCWRRSCEPVPRQWTSKMLCRVRKKMSPTLLKITCSGAARHERLRCLRKSRREQVSLWSRQGLVCMPWETREPLEDAPHTTNIGLAGFSGSQVDSSTWKGIQAVSSVSLHVEFSEARLSQSRARSISTVVKRALLHGWQQSSCRFQATHFVDNFSYIQDLAVRRRCSTPNVLRLEIHSVSGGTTTAATTTRSKTLECRSARGLHRRKAITAYFSVAPPLLVCFGFRPPPFPSLERRGEIPSRAKIIIPRITELVDYVLDIVGVFWLSTKYWVSFFVKFTCYVPKMLIGIINI